MWSYNRFQTTLILMPLVFAFAVALDIYIPAVPQLTQIFQATPVQIQWTLSAFLLAFGLGQLFFGPLSDRFGRRLPLLFSSMAYTLSSLLCAHAHSVGELTLYRVLQAIASCGMLVNANALVRDLYRAKDISIMYTYLNTAISFSPMIAPLLGGWIIIHFDWRACFYVLALLGVFATILVFALVKETHDPEKRLRLNREIFSRYADVLKTGDFLFYAFSGGAGISCLFSFFSVSPYLLQVALHVPVEIFGLYFGVMGLLFFAGSLIGSRLLARYSVFHVVVMGGALILFGGLWMGLWLEIFGLSKVGFIFPMVPISCGAAFVSGGGMGGAMAPFSDKAGIAAALFGCGQFLFSSLVGSIVMWFPVKDTLPLALAVMLMGGGVLAFAWFAYKFLGLIYS
jgi:Bcr/CflA subfamily drug resistance transporter